MKNAQTPVRISIDLSLDVARAFEIILGELGSALAEREIVFEPGPKGSITERNFRVGEAISWKPGEQVLLKWTPANWNAQETTELEMRFERSNGGSRVTIEQRGWGGAVGPADELAGWFARELAAPFLRATAPVAFGDWITDRRARRPSGANSRATYGEPIYHYPNFRVLLTELNLKPEDYLLEVGCGGGAFLKMALQSGCRATAIDHSPEMVCLAQENNRATVEQGRLQVLRADAHHLPFPNGAFTCAVMTGVLGFLSDPVQAFREIRRVLEPGGRFVGLGCDTEWRGTPAAPEPMASRLHFYEADELKAIAINGWFKEVRVERRSLEKFARECGVPAEHLPLFAGPGANFLFARA